MNTLNDYKTGEVIREATEEETQASRQAGNEGVIEVEIEGKKVSCFVEEGINLTVDESVKISPEFDAPMHLEEGL